MKSFKILLVIAGTLCVNKAIAQDPRVSLYNSIPLLVNPAQTGDFEGKYRFLGLLSRVSNDNAHNYFYNASVDFRFGKKENWGIGLNYLQSGAAKFPINGQYFDLSMAKGIALDQADVQELRLGAQVSYIRGHIDEQKGPYDRLLDVGAFRHQKRSLSEPAYVGSDAYVNFSIGAKYMFKLDRLKVETGFSAYNITNPEYNFLYKGSLLKRYRVTALTSLYYQVNPKNAIKIEHYSWKEGVFLRDYKAKRDTAGIHETTYGLTWMRLRKENTFSLGLFTRSWQSAYLVAGMNLNEKWGLNASYEVPFLKSYYNVSHAELGIAFYPFRKKVDKGDQSDRLNRQMKALLPFDTKFCLPCNDQKIVPVPLPKPQLPAVKVPVEDSIPFKFKPGTGLLYKDTIYYNLDKHNIRPDAAAKLNQIGTLMKRFDFISLNVQSHTDLRASVSYNNTLSQNRSNAVETYLLGAGIRANRITKSWLGKSKPINNCISCDDILQEKNRRSELSLYGFTEDNLSLLLSHKIFGEEVRTKAELLAKIKQFISLDPNKLADEGINTTVAVDRSGNGTYYTIQIGAFKSREEEAVLKGLKIFSLLDGTGTQGYFYGVFYDRDEAQNMLGKLKQIGFKDASIKQIGLSVQ